MLNQILSLFATFKIVCYYLLVISYKTGQCIIYTLQIITETLQAFGSSLVSMLQVVFEDFWVFFEDLSQNVSLAVAGMHSLCSSLLDSILLVLHTVKNVVFGIFSGVSGAFDALVDFFCSIYNALALLVTLLKNFVVLLGGGIWFAVTLVPLLLIYVCGAIMSYTRLLVQETFDFTKRMFYEAPNALYNLYCFVSDVPLESLAGLIVGTCIVYIIITFHIFLYQLLTRSLLRIVPGNFSGFWTSLFGNEGKANIDMDSFCIVCREHYKCVLLLPCKHLCLCQTCHATLRNYNRSCPICRKNIQRTMKIYT